MFLFKKVQEQSINNYKKVYELFNILSNQEGKVGLDQQIAVIYELRNLSNYFSVTMRILKASKENWNKEREKRPELSRLIKEADETIEFINKTFVERFFIKLRNKYWKIG